MDPSWLIFAFLGHPDFPSRGLKVLGQKSCRTKVSRIFSIFRPEFCPEFRSEFSPNLLRSFRASFCGRRRPEKIHQKSPPFFNAKFPGKFEEKIHNMFLESGQSNKVLILKSFRGLWTENQGAPKTRNSTTTDPTPPF